MEVAACIFALSHRDLPFYEYAGEFCRLAVGTALDDAAINHLFWLGANYHRPVDLPDTTGLSWREGIFQCLGSVRARTSPSSAALPTRRLRGSLLQSPVREPQSPAAINHNNVYTITNDYINCQFVVLHTCTQTLFHTPHIREMQEIFRRAHNNKRQYVIEPFLVRSVGCKRNHVWRSFLSSPLVLSCLTSAVACFFLCLAMAAGIW